MVKLNTFEMEHVQVAGLRLGGVQELQGLEHDLYASEFRKLAGGVIR